MNLPLQRYWSLLRHYLLPHGWLLGSLAVLLFSTIGLELLVPQILRYFLDQAQLGSATAWLSLIALLFITLAILTQVTAIAETYLAETIACFATNRLRADLTAHCLRLDLSFHQARTPGEMVERIDGDVTVLANFFSRFIITIVGNLLLVLGVLALLAREDWRIGLGVGLFALTTLAAMVRLYVYAQPHWVAVEQASATFYGFVGESLAGAEDIRTSGPTATAYILQRLISQIRHWKDLFLKAVLLGQAVWMAALTLFALANTFALLLAISRLRAQELTVGTIYLIFSYTGLLLTPINRLQAEILDLQHAEASLARVEELQQEQPKIRDGSGATLPAGPLTLNLVDLSFAYTEQRQALAEISLTLPAGGTVGLIGRTGSGKSTLARLLLRFYDPTAGNIHLDGIDLRDLRLADLRQHVALVTQEVQLFAATIRDNLTFFNPTIPDEQLLTAISELGISTWFATLPSGLDTMIGPQGGGLSAGEAQLLAFVRVLLRDPGLIILDEASSRLDPVTERLISVAVGRLLDQRTGIIIAHRLATVQRVDQIIILDGGRIIENGPPQMLAQRSTSRYAQLLRLNTDYFDDEALAQVLQ